MRLHANKSMGKAHLLLTYFFLLVLAMSMWETETDSISAKSNEIQTIRSIVLVQFFPLFYFLYQ